MPNSLMSYTDYLPKKNIPNSFVFHRVTPTELELEVMLIPLKKSYGLYSCPARVLKCARHILCSPLADIINKSVETGIYPDKLKHAKIIPIFKSDDETEVSNYRPISLLSIFNRIFEKMMSIRLKNFLQKHDVLYQNQYGFRENHSTKHAILDLVNQIQINMGQSKYTCGIFIDLRKAFDTVNHSILLRKLQHYGIRGIVKDWFSSYLLNRIQTTQIGNDISEKNRLLTGVPQGSVLGPLLFLIYINDIYNSSDKLQFYLHADDTNLLYADKSLRSLESIVNGELANIYNWLTANKLSLNIKKSNFVIFHSYQKRIDYQVELKMFDNQLNTFISLESKNYVKYLGLLIDSGLTWKYHIDYITTKISKLVGVIAKLRHFVPTSTTLNIYNSLILPHITYGINVWGQAAKVHLNKILKLQKCVLRIINFGQYRSHAIPFFISANVLPVNMLYFKSVSMLMHDVFNNKAPANISNLFTPVREVNTYNTRFSSISNFYVRNSHTNNFKNSFSRAGVRIWNSIPDNLRNISKRRFRKKLHEILFSIFIEEDDYVDVLIISERIKR